MQTLRLWGHFEGDAQAYRPDLEGVPGRDPLPTYQNSLLADGILDDAQIQSIRDEATRRVEDAVAHAKSSPEPDPARVGDYVFA